MVGIPIGSWQETDASVGAVPVNEIGRASVPHFASVQETPPNVPQAIVHVKVRSCSHRRLNSRYHQLPQAHSFATTAPPRG